MKRVRGQGLSEVQGAILIAGVLSIVAGLSIWYTLKGQMNMVDDIGRVFADTVADAQAGTVNLTFVQTGTETTFTVRTGTDPAGGRIVRSTTVQGIWGATYSGGSLAAGNSTNTLIVAPDGQATLAGGAACPANLQLVIDAQPSIPFSCDPLHVVGH